jgi:hypothetical protein
MVTQELARVVVLGAACVLPTACATTSYTRGSVAALPDGFRGRTGSNARLEIEGLKLRIQTLDRAPRNQEIPPLALRFVFDPPELGYSFDPAGVTLRAADGASWSPRVSESGYRMLVPGSCFDLDFDVTLTKQARLELELGGLAHGRKRIDPVRLTLARRAGRSIDRMYWLEAVRVVLTAPLALAGGGM